MAAEVIAEARKRTAAKQYERYRKDPSAYAAEVLGVEWWSKQREIADSVLANRRTAVYAGHAVGKTHMLGGLVQWHYDAFDPSITLTTAPNWSSIHDLLWGEIRSQRRGGAGRLLDMRLDGGPMHYAKGHNAESGTGFQGRHEGYQLIVLDEAMGIPPYIWEATDAMMTGPDCRTLATGNPTETSGQFYDIREDPAWNIIHISCLDHPNIAAELAGLPAPYPKAISLQWVREKLDKNARRVTGDDITADCFEFPPGSGEWYEPDDIFRCRVLGLFPKQASQSVWSEAWLLVARESVLAPAEDTVPEIGADIARFGDDLTVLYGGCRPVVTMREAYAKQDTMQTTGRIVAMANRLGDAYQVNPKNIPIKVDDTGLGGGVTDRLRELEYMAVPVVAGGHAHDRADYYDRRSELWFVAAGYGRKGQLDLSQLPQDVYRKLGAELRGVRYRIQSDKTLRVESKADTKKRTKNSPDDADAFNLWCLPSGAVAQGVAGAANPSSRSRFSRDGLAGGRFGRSAGGKGWHKR